ncbi:hypothetical protein [Nitrosophilus alvini]|uniref:hypothetical protein n=1 Tax=Nitrosophilus alvini TaxID=2714855 RepID=UPI00190BEEC7|nr:hypothetical protein [Nitrosophilus alvini]
MEINSLFGIIPDLPGVRVYQFSDNIDFSKELSKEARNRDFELEIVVFSEDFFYKLNSLEGENIKLRKVEFNKPKYNLRSTLYDTVFVNIDISTLQDIELFFRKIYRMMKNAANIIVPVSKECKEEIAALLEKCNYVAINDIDLDEKNCAIVGRKMHGWARV